ncbi:MAG: Omp28-related outer membrane protein [Bacteroidetes bacterium]|nr:Omp28-related outer membrane protein [Bacteroidota bacterium]
MKAFRILSGLALVAMSCKEQPKGVKFTEPEKPLLDTTYVIGTVPPAQDKIVALFDVTGVRCNNCPEAASLARKIADTLHPGRVVVVALYPSSLPSLTSPWPGFEPLTSDAADAITGNLGAIPNLPIGAVDQIKPAGSYYLDRSTWNGHVNNQLAKTTPLNIDLHTQWITADNKSRVEVKVTYTSAVTAKHLIFIGLIESNVESKQLDKNAPGGSLENYIHNHAMRELITASTGDTLNAQLTAGRVFEKQYYVKTKDTWKPENIEVVVWIVDATTKEIIHISKEEIKP